MRTDEEYEQLQERCSEDPRWAAERIEELENKVEELELELEDAGWGS